MPKFAIATRTPTASGGRAWLDCSKIFVAPPESETDYCVPAAQQEAKHALTAAAPLRAVGGTLNPRGHPSYFGA